MGRFFGGEESEGTGYYQLPGFIFKPDQLIFKNQNIFSKPHKKTPAHLSPGLAYLDKKKPCPERMPRP
ncbi:hypothetical protein AM506_15120 [Rossellomorea vietnamensis]|uniref:Uncharacterized protein n=1 Tax=Rossellomorea vietnamensis TaxID=218284 RepID=A0A0P6WCK4_9BACI|nr:hypothetical protein AM506_15120 [Rossellomorea vietnamensis]